MAKGYSSGGSFGGRAGSSGHGGSRAARAGGYSSAARGSSSGGGTAAQSASGGSASAQRAANSRMWSQPATAKQIAALEAHGHHDGKYYSKGRAGQTIGESVRTAGTNGGARPPRTGISSSHDTWSASGNTAPYGSGELLAALNAVKGIVELQHPASGARECEDAFLTGEVVNEDGYEVIASPGETLPVSMPTDTRPYAFLTDLEERHLRTYQSEYGKYSPTAVLALVKKWTETKTEIAMMVAQARVDIVAILRDAPAGIVSSPEQLADSLLENAFSTELEERHLRTYLQEYGLYSPYAVLGQITQWVETRIEVATKLAHARVDMARKYAPPLPEQRALEPASPAQDAAASHRPSATTAAAATSPQGDEPAPGGKARRRTSANDGNESRPSPIQGARCLGTVVSIKSAYGAIVSLEPGKEGWLHISKLRVLNGGNYVESVESVLQEGENVWVRVIGADDKGKPRLALVAPNRKPQQGVDPVRQEGEVKAPPSPASSTKRGFLAWLGGRWNAPRQPASSSQASGDGR